MNQHVQAIYSNGTLKPLAPLDLKEQELVQLTVSPVPDDAGDALLDEELTYLPVPPRSTTQIPVKFIFQGKGTPMPYDDLTLDAIDDD